ncbi:MAG TPA: neutral zinc metallopeptidase [Allosphingosinicella sp.]|nr:neutral zinc metallopeptidase [Allosphingosinicella sp.]
MRLGDEQESSNFEDRTGQSGGLGGFGGGGGLGLILGLVASRFGIVGVVILLLGYCALTTLGGGGGGNEAPSGVQGGTPGGASTLDPQTKDVVLRVLGSTERRWTDLFAAKGLRYQPTTLIFYSRTNRSGCGIAQSAMGPFYCPTDKSIYLDTSFFQELSQRFGAPGDFAMAYVIAHEVGHHVQDLAGTLDQANAQQTRMSTAEGNALQVRIELQADCYAGVWAANDKNLLEPGDMEEGLKAASAIGDDTLQRETQGQVVPESFTHGTSAQRVAWLRKGLETGNPAACDTFKAVI